MLLYAHRGSPVSSSLDGSHVENTVPAVTAALHAGADGAEVDLRLSADGVLVVCHDATLRRLVGSRLAVAATPWSQLQAVCAQRSVALARVEDVLPVLTGRRVVLELKQPPPGRVPATVDAVLDVLTRMGAAGVPLDVTVSSFAPALVAAVRQAAPPALRLRTALLGDVLDRPTTLLRQALQADHDQIHPQVAALLAEPGAVARAHALGVGVVPWTVNRGPALRRLSALGVDAVITDVPADARRALLPSARAAV